MQFQVGDKVIHTVHRIMQNKDKKRVDKLGSYEAVIVEIKKQMIRLKFQNGMEKDVMPDSIVKAEQTAGHAYQLSHSQLSTVLS